MSVSEKLFKICSTQRECVIEARYVSNMRYDLQPLHTGFLIPFTRGDFLLQRRLTSLGPGVFNFAPTKGARTPFLSQRGIILGCAYVWLQRCVSLQGSCFLISIYLQF